MVERRFIKLSGGGLVTPKLENYYINIRIRAMEEVKKDLIKEMKIKNHSMAIINSIKNKVKNVQDGKSELIDLKVKEIVINQFFDKHIIEKNNLETFLK